MNLQEYNNRVYKQRRQKIIDYLGGKCVKCGNTENLEFDHIDPSKKKYSIGKHLSLNNNKAEIDKCQLLCEVCHRVKTSIENLGYSHGTIYAWMKKRCKCVTCRQAKRNWHDRRNVKRRAITQLV